MLTKIRILISLSTVIIVVLAATIFYFYAKGYRPNKAELGLTPGGILVMKSAPDGAQIFIDGELKTATNATISLPAKTYDIEVKKEGYITWTKRLTINKEEVTEATAHLFKSAPSLTAITFNGASQVVPSQDFSKLSYIIPTRPENDGQQDLGGLWVIEMVNLPLGFVREPRQITDGNLTDATWIWSPDGRQILLSTGNGDFLLDAGTFTPQNSRINITSTREEILEEWQEIDKQRFEARISKLPDELETIVLSSTSDVVFSPDEDMFIYKATKDANIPNELIKPFPGSSTQPQVRDIKKGSVYVYDIKEDKNFLLDENAETLSIVGGTVIETDRMISWFPTARHLVLAESGSITILDYDGTNRSKVYQGSYVAPFAFPTLSLDRVIMLTNLGADGDSLPNLYSLTIK